MPARLVICCLHDSPKVVEAIVKETTFTYDEEYSNQGHDERMVAAFQVSADRVCPSLTDEDFARIDEHKNVTYLLSGRVDGLHTAKEALTIIKDCIRQGSCCLLVGAW